MVAPTLYSQVFLLLNLNYDYSIIHCFSLLCHLLHFFAHFLIFSSSHYLTTTCNAHKPCFLYHLFHYYYYFIFLSMNLKFIGDEVAK